jgi:hypothetical protein
MIIYSNSDNSQKEHPAMFVFISISNFGEEDIDINEDDHLGFYKKIYFMYTSHSLCTISPQIKINS